MSLAHRIKDILLNPQSTWPLIAAEETDVTTLYTQYVMILALIPAMAGFIGMSLIGISVGGQTVQVPLLNGVTTMVVSYVLSLIMVYVLALLANRLAPNFAGEKNPVNAMKLIAYSSTASMAGGVFSLVSALWPLGLLASIYSVYLLFTGISVVMKSPREKALPYTTILVVGNLIGSALLGIVSAIFR